MTDGLARLAIAVGGSSELSIVLKATVVLGLTLVAVALTGLGRSSVRHLLLASSFGVLILLPMAGHQLGLNLDVISTILNTVTGYVIRLLLLVTGNA